jgi:acetoin utilization protein AcuC
MAAYRFAPSHPLVPERFVLAVELMRAWGLLGEGEGQARVYRPEPAHESDLLRVHSADYVAAVMGQRSSSIRDEWIGLGDGDTPRFAHMHEAAALIAGGTIRAMDGVLAGEFDRAFCPAGGLHHAHRERAAGFCVYNDCAVAIARATALNPGLRVAYVDIDAHHGDGVEEAFESRADVLTISVHESGQYLYPGTGASRAIGVGPGEGFSINLPLPPHAGPPEYTLAFDRVVGPALRAFAPDIIVAQLGGDAYQGDPLTHLCMTVEGHVALTARVAALADELCSGRLVATGGGGYEAFSATPRMWAGAMAVLLGNEPPRELPPEWLRLSAHAAQLHGVPPVEVHGTFDELACREPGVPADETLRLTEHAIEQTRASSPLLAG